jgi:RNA polymerase sigma-70 factor (ECF subfamily)
MNHETSDQVLVENFLAGDVLSFNELVNRYNEKVLHLSMRITRSEEDSEEVMQEVFVTVFKKLGGFQGKSAFSSWLYRITVNTAFMKLRKRKKHAAVSLEDLGAGTDDSRWVSERSDLSDIDFLSTRHELRAKLEAAIAQLPDEYRRIFLLRDVDGLSNQEVGEVLDLTVPAVKSRLHRSRLMLRKKLQRFFDDYSSAEEISYGVHPYAREGHMAEAA